jgi:hypothetical protein
MKIKNRVKSLFEREMENPTFRKHFHDEMDALKLEVQFFHALQRSHLSYAEVAEILNTHKGNISRDLKGGRLRLATIPRIERWANAVGMRFVPLLISKEKAHYILPKLQKLIAA